MLVSDSVDDHGAPITGYVRLDASGARRIRGSGNAVVPCFIGLPIRAGDPSVRLGGVSFPRRGLPLFRRGLALRRKTVAESGSQAVIAARGGPIDDREPSPLEGGLGSVAFRLEDRAVMRRPCSMSALLLSPQNIL